MPAYTPLSPLTPHASHLTPLTPHTSRTSRTSHLTSHTSHLTHTCTSVTPDCRYRRLIMTCPNNRCCFAFPSATAAPCPCASSSELSPQALQWPHQPAPLCTNLACMHPPGCAVMNAIFRDLCSSMLRQPCLHVCLTVHDRQGNWLISTAPSHFVHLLSPIHPTHPPSGPHSCPSVPPPDLHPCCMS